MPWTNQSGGSGNGSNNGSGNGGPTRGPTKGPWGQPPRGGGGDGPRQSPPDLEELLKNGRERFRRAAGRGGRGGSGGGGTGISMPPRGVFAIGAVILLGLWAFSGVYQVENNQQAVVTTFGKYSGIQGSGLRWHVPWPVQDATVVTVSAERETQIGGTSTKTSHDGAMLTSDLNIVDVAILVNWRIKQDAVTDNEFPGVAKYVFNVEHPDDLVRAVAESALREVVGSKELDPIISNGRALVPEATRQKMQEALDMYGSGIEIIRVNFLKSDPPTEVVDAFREVIDAGSEAGENINNARGYANKRIPEARGEAQRKVLDAEAYAARVVAEARGSAARFNAIYDEYIKAPAVTRQRMYLETVEKVMGGMDKIILDNSGSGTVPYLNVNELAKKQSQ